MNPARGEVGAVLRPRMASLNPKDLGLKGAKPEKTGIN